MPPADLADFWRSAIEELRRQDLNATLTPAPEVSGREFQTYAVALDSFQGKRLRGWYSAPNDPGPARAAVLAVPGYGGDKPIPFHLVMSGFAVFTLYPRAQGESIPEWDLESDTKLTYHLEDKDRYYYRGGYMDCLRGLDFLCSRDEVDPSRLGMWSRSQGGGFTLATAALDPRLRAAVAEEPFLCNFPVSIDVDTMPYRELGDYLALHPGQRQAMLDTLAYFDTLSLAPWISCPILLNVGLADQVCPYDTIMPVFESIPGPKAIHVYPSLDHNPSADFNSHAMDWLRHYL